MPNRRICWTCFDAIEYVAISYPVLLVLVCSVLVVLYSVHNNDKLCFETGSYTLAVVVRSIIILFRTVSVQRCVPAKQNILFSNASIEMHDEIFRFEKFKNFMKILKYFKTPFLKYFMKLLIFNIKWLKTFKNMIKWLEYIKVVGDT